MLIAPRCCRPDFALLGCLVLAGGLRFFDLEGASVWGDEAVSYTIASADGPTALLGRLANLDATRAPLHPMLVQAWFLAFGRSLLAGRILSAGFGLAAVAIVYGIGRQTADRKTALLVCLLAALNPLDLHHSREIRMYEGLVLATCSAWALLFSFRRSSGWVRRVGYALVLAAICYFHPLGGLMVIALAVGYLILKPTLRLGWGAFVVIHVALAAMLAPWALNYLDHPPQQFPKPLTARLLFEWPEAFTGGNGEAAWAGLALLAFGVIAASRRSGDRIKVLGRSIDRSSAALLAWFVVPPALVLAYSLAKYPIFGERRYLLFVGPAYLLLAARGLAALPIRPRVAVLVAFLFFNVQALDRRVYRLHRPDLRSAERLARTIDPVSPIVVVAAKGDKLYRCLAIYRDPALPGPVLPLAAMLDRLDHPSEPSDASVWIAIERPKDKPRKPIPEGLARHYVVEQSFELPCMTLSYNRRPESLRLPR